MNLDANTNALFKAGLYANVSPQSEAIELFFLEMLKKIFKQMSFFSPQFYLSFISYTYFAKKFISLLETEILNHRAQWLLAHSNSIALVKLEQSKTQKYFKELEEKLFEDYMNQLQLPHPTNWFEIEYYKLRKEFFINLYKKYNNFLFFWCVILVTIYIGLLITAKENSLSIWDLLNSWLNFLLNRLK